MTIRMRGNINAKLSTPSPAYEKHQVLYNFLNALRQSNSMIVLSSSPT
jgi:hypothetical protein